MHEQPQHHRQKQEIEKTLEQIEASTGRDSWRLFDKLERIPVADSSALEAFKEGLYSSHMLVQLASIFNIGRLAHDTDWAIPELKAFLEREQHDVIAASAAVYALQSLQSCEAAQVIADALRRTITLPLPLNDKGAMVSYFLRSLGTMGAVALNQRGVFREAIEFFHDKLEGLWASECSWELDCFIENVSDDLDVLQRTRVLPPIVETELSGESLRLLDCDKRLTLGSWAVIMDEVCSFSYKGFPERLSHSQKWESDDVGFGRVVILEHQRGHRAAIMCSDEMAGGPVSLYEDEASSLISRCVDLDPSATFLLTYRLGRHAEGPFGTLRLIESPGLGIEDASQLFGENFGHLKRFLFRGRPAFDWIAQAAEAMRRDERR